MRHEIKVKPIIQETSLTKAFNELVLKELPIHAWCKRQEAIKKKIKL